MTFTYNLSDAHGPRPATTDLDLVRLLINDVDAATHVFEDEEISAVLTLEGGAVRLAAAQLIDTNADNEALASKVLRTQDLTTDGAKLAQALHARAEQLRNQHYDTLEDGGYFEIIDDSAACGPELAHHRPWFV